MHRGIRTFLCTALALLLWAPPSGALAGGKPNARKARSSVSDRQKPVDFGREVYPLLAARCFRCHQGRNPSSGVRLDDKAELLGTSTGHRLVIPGKGGTSLLFKLVAGKVPDRRMPPRGKGKALTAAEIDVLKRWIDEGLSWDDSLLPPVIRKTDHWAFQPVTRPRVPAVNVAGGIVRNPIDAFVTAKLSERGLHPAGDAPRRVLIRRLFLDMLGVPPSSRELQRFLADERPGAWERLVDRVLASPRYGERWGRHWLDVARWSETEGYESNHPRPFAWRYRDYVVHSLNDDKPYDVFLRQQLAGDEMIPYRDENLIATGFLAAARLSSNEEDKWLQRNDVLVDITNAAGSAFLGLTVGCAQCHNHKFDPLTMRDYYRLQSFFLRGQPANVALRGTALRDRFEERRPADYFSVLARKRAIFQAAHKRYAADVRNKLTARERQAVDTPVDQRSNKQELLARKVSLRFQATPKRIEKQIPRRNRDEYNRLKRKVANWTRRGLVEPQTFAYYSPVTSPHNLNILPSVGFYPLPYDPQRLWRIPAYIKVRGDVHNIGPRVKPGWPAVFDTVFNLKRTSSGRTAGSRLELGQWLTDRRHPLTARVWVNRVWHYHFGRGLVDNPGDFGIRTRKPVHAKLLDWLASELVESGWSTKHIHRLILTSATYRRASTVDARNQKIDPDNRCLWHWSPRRLEAEALRDAMLAVTGELNGSVGGRSVSSEESASSKRRSLYLFQKRGRPPEMQKLFDGPSEASESCPKRHTSTSPLQSLFLLNDEFTLHRAATLAQQIAASAGNDRRAQITAAFRRILGRDPAAEERDASLRFLQRAGDADALTLFCQSLLNLNEFAYIE